MDSKHAGHTVVPEAGGGGSGRGGYGGSWGGGGGEGGSGGKSSEDLLRLWYESQEEDHTVIADAEVSIIIPALNEAACIETTIRQFLLSDPSPARVIVVDGGSVDGTQEKARRLGAVVVSSPKGRAKQQNWGAEVAIQRAGHGRGILCFVHADTLVPLDLVSDTWSMGDKSRGIALLDCSFRKNGSSFPDIQNSALMSGRPMV